MSRLLENSEQFRTTNKARNTFNQEDTYNIAHPNAKADGDERGRGLTNGQVGTSTDINRRTESVTRNLYGKNRPYNIDNA